MTSSGGSHAQGELGGKGGIGGGGLKEGGRGGGEQGEGGIRVKGPVAPEG